MFFSERLSLRAQSTTSSFQLSERFFCPLPLLLPLLPLLLLDEAADAEAAGFVFGAFVFGAAAAAAAVRLSSSSMATSASSAASSAASCSSFSFCCSRSTYWRTCSLES